MEALAKTKTDRVQLFFDNLTPVTRRGYESHIPLLIGEDIRGFVEQAKAEPEEAEAFILQWLADAKNGKIRNRKNGERLGSRSIITYIREVKSLLDFCKSGVDFEEQILKRLPPKNKPRHKAPTIEPFRKLFNILDIRGKFILALMVSGGFRVGAFDYFTLKDLTETDEMGNLLPCGIGKLIVYRGEPEEYFCFVSPECMGFFEMYKSQRIRAGEKLAPNSPLVRAVFDDRRDYNAQQLPRKVQNSGPLPSTDIILRATANSIKLFFHDYWPKVLENRDFKQAHGSRSFYKTTLENSEMKSIFVETLMGHSVRHDDRDEYNRPTDTKLALIYAKYVHLLTISETVELKEKLEKTDQEKRQLEDVYYFRSKRLEDQLADERKAREVEVQRQKEISQRNEEAMRKLLERAIERIEKLESQSRPAGNSS